MWLDLVAKLLFQSVQYDSSQNLYLARSSAISFAFDVFIIINEPEVTSKAFETLHWNLLSTKIALKVVWSSWIPTSKMNFFSPNNKIIGLPCCMKEMNQFLKQKQSFFIGKSMQLQINNSEFFLVDGSCCWRQLL